MSDKRTTSWPRRLLALFHKSAPEIDEEEVQRAATAPPPTLVEWSGHLLSGLLLFGLMGYVLWTAAQPVAPVTFDHRVRMEELREQSGGWILPVELQNQGGMGVLNLTIVAELRDDAGETVDEADIALPLLGAEEWATVELAFEEDPRLHTLYFNLASYSLP